MRTIENSMRNQMSGGSKIEVAILGKSIVLVDWWVWNGDA